MQVDWSVARRLVCLALGLSLLLARCQAGGETKSLHPSGEEAAPSKVEEWMYFVNVMKLLLFQPGRAMGTPWPRKAPFEFVKLFSGQPDFCARCVSLMGNWESSEPPMILYRAQKYVSMFPDVFYVACGSVESKFLSTGSSDGEDKKESSRCVQASSKFSLQKYYEGLSSAPTLRRRAAFPATHTDHRPFRPLYDPLYKAPSTGTKIRRQPPLDFSKHGYVPLIPVRDASGGEQRASHPMSHVSVAVESRHSYVPIVSRAPGPDGPSSTGVFPKNTTHTYVPIINSQKHEDVAAFPASRTSQPSNPNHGYIPLFMASSYSESAAFPASRTSHPANTRHGFIPLYVVSSSHETVPLPASRTGKPTDPNHSFIPLYQRVRYYNITAASLPASRTSQPSEAKHKFIPIFERGCSCAEGGGASCSSSLPASRVRAIIDTSHGYIPVFQRTTEEGCNEAAALPASRTGKPTDPNHRYIPLFEVSVDQNETAALPASRTGKPTDPNHGYIPILERIYYLNGTVALPLSRVSVPVDPNHGYIPLFDSETQMEKVGNASLPASRTSKPTDPNHRFIPLFDSETQTEQVGNASLPASRTSKPTDPNHGYIPLFDSETQIEQVGNASLPASRTSKPTDPNHGYIPLFTKLYLYNDTVPLPASRTGKPTDINHGYIPLFVHNEANETSSLPASRVKVPLNSTHSYIPLTASNQPNGERAAKPASSTAVPAPGAPAGNLPYTILVSIPKAALPASRTDVVSDDHGFIPLVNKREEVGPRAAFPATHTSVEAPGLVQEKQGIDWEHYTEVLKVDSEGNPYVDTVRGRIYGFGDLSFILSQLDQAEAIENQPQNIIEDH